MKKRLNLFNKIRTEVIAAAVLIVYLAGSILYAWKSPAVNPARFSFYEKKLKREDAEVCGTSEGKTYEDYRMITDETSLQYQLIQESLKVDPKTGFLYDKDGFLAVALGYRFGDIGTRYYITLDTGIILPVINTDEKAPKDASNGCEVDINGTVIEFVVDADAAREAFGTITNDFVLDGNYNNSDYFKGSIVRIEKVTE